MYASAPWRTELRRHALMLSESALWPYDDVPFELEKSLFYSAAILRKLIEDRRVTDSFRSKTVKVKTLRTITPQKDHWFREMPGSVEFDRASFATSEVSLYELCNQLIHFIGREWEVDDDCIVVSVLVSSYRAQDKVGYQIILSDWSELLVQAADNEISEMKFIRGLGYQRSKKTRQLSGGFYLEFS